jgi:hypothetical protein
MSFASLWSYSYKQSGEKMPIKNAGLLRKKAFISAYGVAGVACISTQDFFGWFRLDGPSLRSATLTVHFRTIRFAACRSFELCIDRGDAHFHNAEAGIGPD